MHKSIVLEIGNFTKQQKPVTKGVGKAFRLRCTAPEAEPKATVVWKYNNVSITNEVYHVSLYHPSSAQLSHHGTYTCRAENIAGFKEYDVNVTILGLCYNLLYYINAVLLLITFLCFAVVKLYSITFTQINPMLLLIVKWYS